MSLIRKHVAVLQAWACLALVFKPYAQYESTSYLLALLTVVDEAATVAESCADVECRDGEVCVHGRCQCDSTRTDCDDDNNVDDPAVCSTDDVFCHVRSSPTGQYTHVTDVDKIVLCMCTHTCRVSK